MERRCQIAVAILEKLKSKSPKIIYGQEILDTIDHLPLPPILRCEITSILASIGISAPDGPKSAVFSPEQAIDKAIERIRNYSGENSV